MKRVNLIPADIQKQAAVKAKQRIFVLICIVSSFVFVGFINAQYLRIKKSERAVSKNKVKARDLEVELANKRIEFEENSKALENIELEKKIVLQRIELLDSKSSRGKAVSSVLVSVSELIPEEIWLKKIILNDDEISIKGETLDNTIVSKFMRDLDTHKIFEKTDFKYIQKVETELRTFIDFEITSRIKVDTL